MDSKFVARQLALQVEVGDYRDPGKLIERLRDEQRLKPDKIISGTHGAWSVSYSHTPESGRIFSARLRQRSSKARDWIVLGRMATMIGAPQDRMPSTIKTTPEATHYWIWDGPAVPTDADLDEVRAQVRAKMGH